ncbi:MAG TPA: hypothetical protein VN517_04935 [Terriglobales bacterium]|nr:hypothetical protein [Terriglobales bacterium]
MPLRGKTTCSMLAICGILAFTFNASAQDGSTSAKCGFQKFTINAPAGTKPTPTDLNDNGAVAGLLGTGSGANFRIKGFFQSGGKFTSFNFPGARDTVPMDLTKSGVIVGSFDTTTGNGQRAFKLQNGVFRQVTIPGFPDAPAIATGVNELGDIAGQFNGNGSDFGFLLHNGKLTILSFSGAAGGTFPTSINNSGVIVGFYHLTEEGDVDHGFMWKAGVFTNLRTPSGGALRPEKISDRGDIVGTYIDSNLKEHGFALDGGRFSTIDPPGSLDTKILALNNYDNILSIFSTSAGNTLVKGFCSAVF